MQGVLRSTAVRAGGARALSREWGISASYISMMLKGERPITDDVAQRLGYARVERVEFVLLGED